MRVVAFTAAVLMLLSGASASTVEQFQAFKAQYNKKYASAEEEAARLRVFNTNMQRAAELQKANPLAQFGMNAFADRTEAEFKVMHNGDAHFKAATAKHNPIRLGAEQVRGAKGQAVDWRAKGAVTGVKNQGQCGSCWSFSTTGNIEGQWFLAGNKLVALSEQELVSCDHTDNACHGGLMDNAFNWLVKNRNGDITSEAQYPYVSGAGNVPACELPKPTAATIYGHTDIAHNEDEMAAQVLTGGPLSIGVDATSWQSYQGGIMTNCISRQVDHGVLIVGFDDNASPPYWIIKNSWTASWGEEGYIRVKKGTDQCLITTAPSTSKVHKAGPGPVPTTAPAPAPTSPVPTSPVPPTPTQAPVVPPPAPSTGTFSQYICDDFLCLAGCKKHTLPTGRCLREQGGGSVIATCGASLELESFPNSQDCTGASVNASQPLNECVEDKAGTFIYDVCGKGDAVMSKRPVTLPKSLTDRLRK